MRVAPPIVLTPDEKRTLERLARGRRTEVRLAERAKLVLLAADGWLNKDIASELETTAKRVGMWRTRYANERLAGIEKDRPRGGRLPKKRDALEPLIIKKTTQEKPRNATHWSVRSLAKELGVTISMVHRVWTANNLKPHLIKTFKISTDPKFEEKLVDVVGLYLDPPKNALVLSVDEKSGCQALDRTQPSLPLYPGRCGTLTHDYKRNGTTTLFAAIEMAAGRIIAECQPRNRHQEFLGFLKTINKQTPRDLDLHLILDNLATHKHPKVKRWLSRNKRFKLHFIPTSSSWLNVIEIFFRNLTDKQLRRGAFRNIRELVDTIMDYVEAHNKDPKPFVWTAKADAIIEKVGRARVALKIVEQAGTHH